MLWEPQVGKRAAEGLQISNSRMHSDLGRPTRWFVRKAVPALLCIANGSFPGYEFGVCIASVVRCGEVKRIRSLGSGTKPVVSSSITQLSTRSRSLFSMLFFCGFDTITQQARSRV